MEPFDIRKFALELRERSAEKNRLYSQASEHITAHDVADNCLVAILYRLRNVEVEDYATVWLPVLMRAVIGSGIHDFIQRHSQQFTEVEVGVKVPSLRFSGVVDCLIGTNILVEIKSCSYSDYVKILTDRKPRLPDLLQGLVYIHMLENYLSEIKDAPSSRQLNRPRAENYAFDYLQIIYVAHDLIAADVGSLAEALELVKKAKSLTSRDEFYFMTTMLLDLRKVDLSKYYKYVLDKIAEVNYYLDNGSLPDRDNKFINRKNCYFCLYKNICDYRGER